MTAVYVGTKEGGAALLPGSLVNDAILTPAVVKWYHTSHEISKHLKYPEIPGMDELSRS